MAEGAETPSAGEFPAVDLSLVLDRLNSAPMAIVAVMIVALLVLLCIGMTALFRSNPENIPETLHGIASTSLSRAGGEGVHRVVTRPSQAGTGRTAASRPGGGQVTVY